MPVDGVGKHMGRSLSPAATIRKQGAAIILALSYCRVLSCPAAKRLGCRLARKQTFTAKTPLLSMTRCGHSADRYVE
jgi:hypothetical protein